MLVGVPERTGVAFLVVSVEVSTSVSFDIVESVSEMGGVNTVIDGLMDNPELHRWLDSSGYFGHSFVLQKIVSGV
jgi:hypothetical protein